jgi:hypothetical protein
MKKKEMEKIKKEDRNENKKMKKDMKKERIMRFYSR